ncbi:MAG: DUF4255 domain-containing protein [Cyanobacteria bacterium P01_D01_bin.44]
MSNHLAIATVTAAFSQLLQRAATDAVPGATVTTKRPERVEQGIPETRVNVYLYQVSPNLNMRNADLPTRHSNATLVQQPITALDLFYLVSFYGDENQLEPQRLLGKTVSTVHARPILTPALIRDTIRTASAADTDHYLTGSDLADQIDQVRFTPGSLTLEEFSKLWSLLSFHAPHALSLIYQASVVLIEADEQPQRALPVRGGRFGAAPFLQPSIDQVQAATGVNDPIVSNSAVTIVGQRLLGDETRVRIGDVEVTPTWDQISDAGITVSLPAGLRAGVQQVQVHYQVRNASGNPTQRANGQGATNGQRINDQGINASMPPPYRAESNMLPFVLRPTITSVTAPDATTVTVTLDPAVGRDQRVVLWLNEFNPPVDRAARTYSFQAPTNNGIADTRSQIGGQPSAGQPETTIAFTVRNVVAGDYLVRVHVDGAESPLVVDTAPNSATYNQYASPRVTIPA